MADTYMQKEKECYICRMLYGIHNDIGLHKHHIFEGWANRQVSERMGAWIWCCGKHHNLSDFGIHFNKGLDMKVKRQAQMRFEKDHTREEFMALIGRNYLDDGERTED